MYFDTIALLTAQNPVPTNTEFIVGGYYAHGDGGGGTFIWIPTSGTPPWGDDGITFNATIPQNGYFKRLYSGYINVRWFGAVYDSYFVDVTAMVNNAMNSDAAKTGTIYFPKGIYAGHFVVNSPSKISMIGDGRATILSNYHDPVSGAPVYDEVILIKKHEGVKALIKNMLVEGIYGAYAKTYNGLAFDENDKDSGGIYCEGVAFENLDKAVYKPSGDINNTFVNCTFSDNNYGYYAQNAPIGVMHCGADEIIR